LLAGSRAFVLGLSCRPANENPRPAMALARPRNLHVASTGRLGADARPGTRCGALPRGGETLLYLPAPATHVDLCASSTR
jgi:hypothetical protein